MQLLRRFSWAFFKASETTFNTFWRKRPILFASINHARVLPAKNRGYVHPILVLATRVEFGACYLFWSTRVRRPVMEHHTADNTLCVESDRGSPAGRSRGWLVLTMVHRSRPDNGLANRAAQCEPIAGSKRESDTAAQRVAVNAVSHIGADVFGRIASRRGLRWHRRGRHPRGGRVMDCGVQGGRQRAIAWP